MKTRRAFRQAFLSALGLGFTGTTTATGAVGTVVDSKFSKYPDDYFNRAELLVTEGTEDNGTVHYVTDFVSSTGTFSITPDFASALGSGIDFEVVKDEATFAGWNSLLRQTYEYLSKRILIPAFDESITLVAGTYLYTVPYEYTRTALVADAGGSTTTLLDAALTEAADYWNGALVIPTSGALAGAFRYVSDFSASADTLTVITPWASAPDTLTYTLFKPRLYSIHRIYYYESSGKLVRMGRQGWSIDRLGGESQIRFHHAQYAENGFTDIISRAELVPAKQIRIEGYRKAKDPAAETDPIEIEESVMLSWLRLLWHENYAWRDKMDPLSHLQLIVAARNFAEEELEGNAVTLPSESVLV